MLLFPTTCRWYSSMIMNLLDLPDELLEFCCSSDVQVAQTLSLTCRRISPIATKRLFSHLHLLPTTASAKKARAILEDDKLNALVKTISIRASLRVNQRSEQIEQLTWDIHDKDDPEWAEGDQHGVDIDGEPSTTFKVMLEDIGLFKNLRRVELIHDSDVSSDRLQAAAVPDALSCNLTIVQIT